MKPKHRLAWLITCETQLYIGLVGNPVKPINTLDWLCLVVHFSMCDPRLDSLINPTVNDGLDKFLINPYVGLDGP